MVVPPSPRAADPRPARTRAAIHAAVERLTATAGAEVTVNAIAQEAGVSRTSFYAQFEDLDALAVSMLVDTFRDIGHDDVVARRAAGADAHQAARSSAFRLVEHIAARRAFYRASLDWKLTARVREVVEAAFAEQVLVSLDVAPERVPAALDRRDAARLAPRRRRLRDRPGGRGRPVRVAHARLADPTELTPYSARPGGDPALASAHTSKKTEGTP
jgi:AcrR family transcriptional regulator